MRRGVAKIRQLATTCERPTVNVALSWERQVSATVTIVQLGGLAAVCQAVLVDAQLLQDHHGAFGMFYHTQVRLFTSLISGGFV